MRKYILLFMLSCVSLLHATAQEFITIDNIKYYIDNGEATIAVQDENLSGNINIPESISYEGCNYTVARATNGAFKNTDITNITMPNSIMSLGNSCFESCNKLISVKLPNNITSLGDNTFKFCSKLSFIELPNNISSLGKKCFNFSGLKSISLPNSILRLGEDCFRSCNSLENIELSNSISSLPDGCFMYCYNLTSITLPENIITIGFYCFQDCVNLISIDLPKSLKYIIGDNKETGSFTGCTSLMKVSCHWDNLDGIDVGSCAFANIFSEARLYIPKGTTAIYKAKEPWSNFKYIIEENDITEDAEKCQTPTISYSDKKLTFTSLTEGAQYHYTITNDDVKTEAFSESGYVDLSAKYNISVYASADGYINSDRATATLYFINAGLESTTDVLQIEKQRGVLISTDGGYISISGLDDNEKVYLYNLQGVSLAEGTACAGAVSLNAGNEKGIVIVKIGEQSIKVKLNH